MWMLGNWMSSITLFSLPTQYLILQCFEPLLCYSFFYLPKWYKKGKRWNKIKTSRPFWNAKYIDGFTVNTSVKGKWNFQQTIEKNVTAYTIKREPREDSILPIVKLTSSRWILGKANEALATEGGRYNSNISNGWNAIYQPEFTEAGSEATAGRSNTELGHHKLIPCEP